MNPESIRILSPKPAQWEKRGKSAKPLKPEDVAAALGMADPSAALLGRLVYADQIQYIERLRTDMKVEIAGDPRAQKWELPRPGWVEDLCSLALIEAMAEKALPEDQQACFVNMPFWRWKRYWKREYERVVVSLVEAWRDELNKTLRRE